VDRSLPDLGGHEPWEPRGPVDKWVDYRGQPWRRDAPRDFWHPLSNAQVRSCSVCGAGSRLSGVAEQRGGARAAWSWWARSRGAEAETDADADECSGCRRGGRGASVGIRCTRGGRLGRTRRGDRRRGATLAARRRRQPPLCRDALEVSRMSHVRSSPRHQPRQHPGERDREPARAGDRGRDTRGAGLCASGARGARTSGPTLRRCSRVARPAGRVQK
jgi:hypothetical protein